MGGKGLLLIRIVLNGILFWIERILSQDNLRCAAEGVTKVTDSHLSPAVGENTANSKHAGLQLLDG